MKEGSVIGWRATGGASSGGEAQKALASPSHRQISVSRHLHGKLLA
jgi:hypothetical protein